VDGDLGIAGRDPDFGGASAEGRIRKNEWGARLGRAHAWARTVGRGEKDGVGGGWSFSNRGAGLNYFIFF